jgi:hypothetical protein
MPFAAFQNVNPVDMKCREFESRLNDVLDDRGQPRADGQLAAHAATCEPCRELLDGQAALFAGLAHRPLAAAPASGFARRVVADAAPLVSLGESRFRRIGWALATVLSAAAAALLIVSLVWQARQNTAPREGNNVVTVPQPKPGESAPRRGGSGSGLAMAQADWLIEAPRLPSRIRGSYRGTIDNLAVALPETVQRLDEVEHYAPGIRPIRVSFGVLLDAFWRALPGGDSDEQPTRTSYQPYDHRHVA